MLYLVMYNIIIISVIAISSQHRDNDMKFLILIYRHMPDTTVILLWYCCGWVTRSISILLYYLLAAQAMF